MGFQCIKAGGFFEVSNYGGLGKRWEKLIQQNESGPVCQWATNSD